MFNDYNLTVIRGLPGSGKTTLARDMAEQSKGAMIIEPDMMLYKSGVYIYSVANYDRAVNCADRVLALCARMRSDVFYTDVLPTTRSIARIVNHYAYNYGGRDISAMVITIPCSIEASFKRNRHKVPIEDIQRFEKKFVYRVPCGVFEYDTYTLRVDAFTYRDGDFYQDEQ